jgi:hypothetical protein
MAKRHPCRRVPAPTSPSRDERSSSRPNDSQRRLATQISARARTGLLEKIVNALGLDREYVDTLVAEDRRVFEENWQRWVTEPVEPELRRRLIPAVWGRTQMPKDLSREEAVEFARTRAVDERLIYLLVWSRMEKIWCYPDGTTFVNMMEVGEAAGPFTRLRGRGNRGFIFG